MRIQKKFRFGFNSQSQSFLIAALVIGMVLAVGGSVFATTVGNSIAVTSDLSVTGVSTLTGNTGIATTTAGSRLSIQGVGNFVSAASSTLYTPFITSNLTATSSVLLATNTGLVGIGTSSPGSLLSIQGIGNFVSAATSTLYNGFAVTGLSATSSGITVTGGNILHASANFVIRADGYVGVGTSSPGTSLSIQGVANFASTTGATSTIYSTLILPSFSATSTVATTTIATGGLQVGQADALAAFTVGSSATTSVGVGTSTVTSHQFAVSGNALISGTVGTTTLAISSSADGVGGCIQMRAASSSDMYRIYIGKTEWVGSTTSLMIERGSCR